MVIVDRDLCIGCGICAADCVGKKIKIEDGTAVIKNPCIQCGHCIAVCPQQAISIPEYDMEDIEPASSLEMEFTDPDIFLHGIKSKRSIRNYKADKIDDSILEKITQAGRYTATAKNSQDLTFAFVSKDIDHFKDMVWTELEDLVEGTAFSEKQAANFKASVMIRKKDRNNDFLFYNAPAVLFISSSYYPLDAGLAAKNMELMAQLFGLGAMYNGYLAKIITKSTVCRSWLGISGEVQACMLLGYPDVNYLRTAPRAKAKVIYK